MYIVIHRKYNIQVYCDTQESMRSVSSYRSSLAHKMNHSFRNNCQFSDMEHPIFGHIPCTMANRDIKRGEELFVHYGYSLTDCPEWYEELYNQL